MAETGVMADGGGMMPAYPQVFVVDSQAPCVPGPVQVYPRTRGATWCQRILFVLVCLALLGVFIEACCIYNLHKGHNEESSSTGQEKNEKQVSNEIQPHNHTTTGSIKQEREKKPAALLIATQYPQGKDGKSIKDNEPLLWTQEGDGFLQDMDYKNGCLTVKQEGTYFLYSKIAVQEPHCAIVKHTVNRISQRYGNGSKSMELMQSVGYRCPKLSQKDKQDKQDLSDMASSYLGGAFHLFANDSIYVTLNVKLKPGNTENFFGAFML